MRENTLGWDDAMDSVEALRALEAIFEIEIDDDEAAAIQTVGDLFDVILEKRAPGPSGKCASAMAFYRLRQALGVARLAPTRDITFLNQRGAKAALKDLHATTGLAVPPARYAWLGTIGCAAACVGGLALALAFFVALDGHHCVWLLGAALTMTAGIAATRFDKGLVPRGCETLGGLARATASASYGELVCHGARARESEMWDILTATLAARANVAEINRHTTFYQGQEAA